MNYAVKVLFKGRVQGVGFRWYTVQTARSFNVNGYVKNLPNGDVAVEAEGEKQSVIDFIHKLRNGPAAAHVTDVQIDELPYENRFDNFDVSY